MYVCRLWVLFSGLGNIAKGQWLGTMNDMQVLIEQMVSDISSQVVRLDEVRLQKFLEWLNAHSSKVKTITSPDGQAGKRIEFQSDGRIDECLKNGLRTWFESLPMLGLLWEYHLILNEIAWWWDLDPRRLIMIMRSEAGK